MQSVTRYLWSALSPSLSDLHVEASSLLCWTHTLCPGHTCETTLLREFTTEVSPPLSTTNYANCYRYTHVEE